MGFTDLATLKGMLNIPTSDTSRDSYLTMLVNAANKQILDVFQLDSTDPTAYTDKVSFDDDSTPAFFTQRWPVLAVATVTELGTVVQSSQYSFNDLGLILRLTGFLGANRYWRGAFWQSGRESVVIDYTAGWATGTIPADLIYAATLMAAYSFNTAPKAGLSSEQIGQYSYQLGAGAVGSGSGAGGGYGIPPEAERILANYARVFQLPN